MILFALGTYFFKQQGDQFLIGPYHPPFYSIFMISCNRNICNSTVQDSYTFTINSFVLADCKNEK